MSVEPNSSDRLQQLKELMLGDERRELHALRERLDELEDESIQRLADNLANAINHRREMGEASFDEFVAALQVGTESAIQRSVSEDKSRLSTALFPIMGPAIRSYVVELFRGMAAELNEAIKNTTSVERIRWRFQARLAGKPYSEYVMLKTRVFRIEEVYLMQRDTGLLLMHASIDPQKESHDELDLMSGMFTAIRSFVRDSPLGLDDDEPASQAAGPQEENEGKDLGLFTRGDRDVLIEAGPSMVIAAVSKGVPPPAYRDDLKEILEHLHGELQDHLNRFHGDMAVLEPGRPTLRRALAENREQGSKGGMWRAWLLIAVVLGALGSWWFLGHRENRQWQEFETGLRAQPGIAITGIDESGWGNRRSVTGLRDPLAVAPAKFAEDFSINLEKTAFHFELMESRHPEIVALRDAKRLEEDSELAATLSGMRDDISSSREAAETGITGAKSELSSALDEVRAQSQRMLESLVRSQFGAIEGLEVEFAQDGTIAFSGAIHQDDYATLEARLEPLRALGKVDSSAVVNDSGRRIAELTREIEMAKILFDSGSLDREDGDKLDRLCELAAELDGLSVKLGNTKYTYRVLAHPLIGLNREANRVVENDRARKVRAQLIARGIPGAQIETALSEDQNLEGTGVSVVPVPTSAESP